MRELIVIAHDMRSTHNVGSLLRTAEGLGVRKVYLTGYTPYPLAPDDSRLPHLSKKLDEQIDKTALGAAKLLPWEYAQDVRSVIEHLQREGYHVAALEQTAAAINLHEYDAPEKVALLLGTEVDGLPPDLLKLCKPHLIIPMAGRKESFNVVQAAAMALYRLRFY